MITRNWSNVAAKKGARPCVPAPAGPAFGAFADPGEIHLSPGATKTVKVRAWSSEPIKPFALIANSADPSVTATLSGSSAKNGDELTLTLKASPTRKEEVGSNLVMVYAIIDDYSVRHSLIVHGP